MKFSEKYYKGLNAEQHYINNVWFIEKLSMLNCLTKELKVLPAVPPISNQRLQISY